MGSRTSTINIVRFQETQIPMAEAPYVVPKPDTVGVQPDTTILLVLSLDLVPGSLV